MKAYTNGERVLRVEAITHNTRDPGLWQVLDRWGEFTTRLAGMADRFCTALDCVDVGFLPDGIRSPQRGRRPAAWTIIDHDYDQLRIDMRKLLADLAITTPAAA